MRALLIPVDSNEPVREVELAGNDDDSGTRLAQLQGLVGGTIQAVPFPFRDDATCYLHEEGKYVHGVEGHNRRATDVLLPVLMPGDWVAGPLVVAGFDPNTGEHLEDVPQAAERRVRLVEREA